MNDFFEIVRFVGNATWKVLPFFLLSMFLSVMINMMDLKDAIRKAFAGREGFAVLLATAVGAFSPFCSCTVIPVIAGLLMSGVPLAPVMSFWIASPTMDPEIFTLTIGIPGLASCPGTVGSVLGLESGCRVSNAVAVPNGILQSDPSRGRRAITSVECVGLLQGSRGKPPCADRPEGPAGRMLFSGPGNGKCRSSAGNPYPCLVGFRRSKYPAYRLGCLCPPDGRSELAARPLASCGFHTRGAHHKVCPAGNHRLHFR